MRVTLDDLRDREACEEAVGLFFQVFGEEANVTEANLRLANRMGLDLLWFANEFRGCVQHFRCLLQIEPHTWRVFYDLDEEPRDDTREAACKAGAALWYAKYCDSRPHWVTRQCVCKQSALEAYEYAKNVDRRPTVEITAALRGAKISQVYTRWASLHGDWPEICRKLNEQTK